jgi:hypothetical protein
MNKNVIFICSILILNISLSAQKNELVTVRAGTRVIDYFPLKERYRYPEFTNGQVLFKNGASSTNKLNYNLLMGEMEFLQARDTLSIIKKKDIGLIVVAQDTFYYDNGYLEQIAGGKFKVVLKEYIKLKEVLSKDSYGTSSSGSASNTFGTLPAEGNFYKLTANKDMVFQKTFEYYFATPSSGFIQFSKKNVIRLFPQKEDAIKAYLKSNKVDFNSRDDLLRLADFLHGL